MSIEYKTLLVEKAVECPNCDQAYGIGAVLYEDDYRGEVLCPLCKEDYEEVVLSEEGENGEFVR